MAQVQKVGGEIIVHAQIGKNAVAIPSIVGLESGGFAVTWTEIRVDENPDFGSRTDKDIRAQIFDAQGVKVTSDAAGFLVNGSLASSRTYQYDSKVAALKNGGVAVTWSDDTGSYAATETKAQIFTGKGVLEGGKIPVNTTLIYGQYASAVTGLANGNVVVAWRDESGLVDSRGNPTYSNGIKGQIFDATGAKVGTEMSLNTTTKGVRDAPEISKLANGGFVVSWQTATNAKTDVNERDIYGQVFNAAGAKVGKEFLINTTVAGWQSDSMITGLANGGFVVSWIDRGIIGATTPEPVVKAQIFSASGVRSGGEFEIAAAGSPTITGLASGDFVVSWTERARDGSGMFSSDIAGQLYSSVGAKVGEQFQINAETLGNQVELSVSALAKGEFVVSWHDEKVGVKAQMFALSTSSILETQGVTVLDTVAKFASYDRIVAADTPERQGETVYLQVTDAGKLDLAKALEGQRAVSITASDKGNEIIAGAKDDTLYGGAGADTLRGGGGDDTLQDSNTYASDADLLVGGAGNDTITSLGGEDTIEGGAGDDRIALYDIGRTATIDGGEGRDVLAGAYDITRLTISNVEVLEAGSVVATAAQLAGFSRIVAYDNADYDTTAINVQLSGTGRIDLTTALEGKRAAYVTASDAGNEIVGGSKNDTLTGGAPATMC